MSKNGDDGPQFLDFGVEVVEGRSKLILHVFCEAMGVGGLGYFFGEEMGEYFLFEDGGAVLPILGVSLHEGPAVDVADVGLAVGAQQIEAADFLLEFLHDPVADKLLIGSQDDGIAHLLSLLVSLHHSVQGGRSPGFGVHVVGADRVDLDIEGVGGQIFFVDVVSVLADFILVVLVLTRAVLDFPEELFASSAHGLRVVHADFVIF